MNEVWSTALVYILFNQCLLAYNIDKTWYCWIAAMKKGIVNLPFFDFIPFDADIQVAALSLLYLSSFSLFELTSEPNILRLVLTTFFKLRLSDTTNEISLDLFRASQMQRLKIKTAWQSYTHNIHVTLVTDNIHTWGQITTNLSVVTDQPENLSHHTSVHQTRSGLVRPNISCVFTLSRCIVSFA